MKHIVSLCVLFFSMFTASAQWNDSTNQNLETAGLQSGDVIAGATSNGGTFIAFYSQNGANFDMRVQLLNAQGIKQFGADGMLINTLPTGSATYVFNAIVDNADNFIVAYNDQRNGTNGTVINLVKTDGTLPWGLNGIYLGPGLSPYPAALSNGEIAVAWGNSSNTISIQKITAAGTLAWGSPKIISSINTRPVTRPQLVALTSGKFSMVYQQRTSSTPTPSNLWTLQFDNNGDSAWARVKISDNFTTTSTYYSVVPSGDTTYVGYYGNPPSASNRFFSYLQRVNPDGTLPWLLNGTEFANDHIYDQLVTHIALQPGGNTVWSVSNCTTASQSPYGIYAQKFSTTTGLRLLTDAAKAIFVPNANRQQHAGNISVVNATDIMFMYNDVNNKLYGTRLDASGNFVFANSTVELGSTLNAKLRYNFVPVINGQAVAVWSENRGVQNRPYAQNLRINGNTGPLPVTLLSFTGYMQKNNVTLSWKTATEISNKGFYVQSSTNGSEFHDILYLPTNAINGNSNLELSYQCTDHPISNGVIFYKLKQVDKDGRFAYSQIISFVKKADLSVDKVYPNPVRGNLNITLTSSENATKDYVIYDMLGRSVTTASMRVSRGTFDYFIDAASILNGTYLLKFTDKVGNITTARFVKMESAE